MDLNNYRNYEFLTQKSDICLLNMPISVTGTPPIGLGILKSILQQADFETSVVYANLLFAEYIEFPRWCRVGSLYNHTTNIREWLFSHCAFPDHKENVESYLNLILSELKAIEKYYCGKPYIDEVLIKEDLLFTKNMAVKFINELAQLIVAKKPKIVGCSSAGAQNLASIAILKKIKEIAPNTTTIIGGSNCSGRMGVALVRNFPWIDFVCTGEADDTIVPLCSTIIHGTLTPNIEQLPVGIFNSIKVKLYEENGTINDNNKLYSITKTLNVIPPPDYSEYFTTLDAMSYKNQVHPILLLEASRGCWWGKCKFCALCVGVKSVRIKDYQLVLHEIQSLSHKYNVKDIFFVDIALPMIYFKNLIPKLASLPSKCNIFFEVRANLQEHHIKQLVKANIKWVQCGIESLNDSFLNLMNKGISTVINLNFLKKAVENGIDVIWGLIADFPEQDIEWFKKSAEDFPLFHHLPPPTRINELMFQRYSHYYANKDIYKLNLKPFPSFKFLYHLDAKELNDLCHDFHSEYYGMPTGNQIEDKVKKYEFLSDAILAWRQAWAKKGREAILLMKNKNECVEILDTRNCAVAKKHHFNGIFASILTLTETPVSISDVSKKLEELYGKMYHEYDIKSSINILKQKKILYEHNGMLLNLAIRQREETSHMFLPRSDQ